MAKAKKETPQGEFNGFRVGDTGVKVGGMVYAAGSVIPKELVTDELSPYLVGEANVEDGATDTDTLETDEQKEHREEIQALEGTPVEGEGESL